MARPVVVEGWQVAVKDCPTLGTVKLLAFREGGGMHLMEIPKGLVKDLVSQLRTVR